MKKKKMGKNELMLWYKSYSLWGRPLLLIYVCYIHHRRISLPWLLSTFLHTYSIKYMYTSIDLINSYIYYTRLRLANSPRTIYLNVQRPLSWTLSSSLQTRPPRGVEARRRYMSNDCWAHFFISFTIPANQESMRRFLRFCPLKAMQNSACLRPSRMLKYCYHC